MQVEGWMGSPLQLAFYFVHVSSASDALQEVVPRVQLLGQDRTNRHIFLEGQFALTMCLQACAWCIIDMCTSYIAKPFRPVFPSHWAHPSHAKHPHSLCISHLMYTSHSCVPHRCYNLTVCAHLLHNVSLTVQIHFTYGQCLTQWVRL